MMQRLLPALALLAGLMMSSAVEVRAQGYFGRNKVQYRAIDMQVIETEHFLIHFDEDTRIAALAAAQMAERSYTRLSRILQHEFREKKPIIIYASHSEFQQTNAIPDFIDESTGAFAEPIRNRIVIPFTGAQAEFEHVLTHELVHAFQFDVLYRRGIMTDAAPFSRPPLWFMEGMAEYLSIGHIDAHTASWVRDASLAGYLRTVEQMSQRDDYLSYRFGQSLWAYIGQHWGDEAIGVILQQAPRIGLSRAFQRTLGISVSELGREWVAQVRSEHLPNVMDLDRPSDFADRLTPHERITDPWYLAPAVSPDGRQMVFLSQRDGYSFDLYLADARTGAVRKKLVEAARDAGFESLRFMNSSAAFSSDGRYLAFVAQTGGRDALYILDLERDRTHKLQFEELNGISAPTWSPDGTRIAFSGMTGGLSDLYVTDVNGNELERLTADAYAELLPAWSPDGSTIAFTTDRGADTDLDQLKFGNYRVALYHLDRGEIEVLPNQSDGKNVNPVWSPDGQSLVWVSDRTGVNNLYLFDLGTRELYQLTNLQSGIIGITPLSPVLSWAQQEGPLLFVYFEQSGYNIYAAADPRELPRTPVPEQAPDATSPSLIASTAPVPESAPVAMSSGYDDADTASSVAVTSFYRSENGIRPSAKLPVNARDSGGPITVMALLDSLAVPDTADFVVRDYSVQFTPDAIGRPTIGASVGNGSYGNGVFGGSSIALSDMLGNHNILAAGNINGSLADANVFLGYSFLKNRANWGVSVEQVPFYRYLGGGITTEVPGAGGAPAVVQAWQRHLIRSVHGVMSYPFSTFRRFELGASGVHLSEDRIYRGYLYATGEPLSNTDRIGSMKYFLPSAALVFDNSLFGWTGPVVGRRYRLQIAQAMGDFSFTEGLVDFRNYVNWRQRFVLATRFVALTRMGEDADKFPMFWGGSYMLRGYDGNSFDIDGEECAAHTSTISPCPVRDQLIGASGAMLNVELRFPVIEEFQIGFLGNFPPIDLVAFFDGGMAWAQDVCVTETTIWDTTTCPEQDRRSVQLAWNRGDADPYLVRSPLFSYGVGLRFNVFYTILRLDYAIPLSRPNQRGRFTVSFGPSF